MRHGPLLVPISCAVVCCALLAQSPEDYRQAYAAWMGTAVNLETDAAKVGELLAVRTDAASPAAVKFESSRKAYFEAQSAPAAEAARKMEPLVLPAELSSAKKADDLIAGQESALTKNSAALAGDPDAGIQRLRQALDKERASLVAIREAVATRKTAAMTAQQAADAAEAARMHATDDLNAIATNFQASAEAAGKLADAWPAYYRSLAEGARGKASDGTAVSSNAPAGASEPAASASTPNSAPNAAASSPRSSGATPATTAAPAVQPAMPLMRYTGSWGFAKGISNYYGEQPTMFDVLVKVEDGQLQGMVSAVFIAARSKEPSVKFTFNGPLQATRNQVFSLKTGDGVTGTVELIPGPAFNLLEVKFNLDDAPRKVSVSDVTLLKK